MGVAAEFIRPAASAGHGGLDDDLPLGLLAAVVEHGLAPKMSGGAQGGSMQLLELASQQLRVRSEVEDRDDRRHGAAGRRRLRVACPEVPRAQVRRPKRALVEIRLLGPREGDGGRDCGHRCKVGTIPVAAQRAVVGATQK